MPFAQKNPTTIFSYRKKLTCIFCAISLLCLVLRPRVTTVRKSSLLKFIIAESRHVIEKDDDQK
jgi:hypothetical protein